MILSPSVRVHWFVFLPYLESPNPIFHSEPHSKRAPLCSELSLNDWLQTFKYFHRIVRSGPSLPQSFFLQLSLSINLGISLSILVSLYLSWYLSFSLTLYIKPLSLLSNKHFFGVLYYFCNKLFMAAEVLVFSLDLAHFIEQCSLRSG